MCSLSPHYRWLSDSGPAAGWSILIKTFQAAVHPSGFRPGTNICLCVTGHPGTSGPSSNTSPPGSPMRFPNGNTARLVFHVLPWRSANVWHFWNFMIHRRSWQPRQHFSSPGKGGFMVDFCPKRIHIVPGTTARICRGWKGWWWRETGVRLLSIRQEGQKPPLSVPTFLSPKGFYRPADSNAATIITS